MSQAADPSADGPVGIGSGESQDVETPETDVFELLSNDRRRYALHHLEQAEEPVDLGDLAEQIAAWEEGKSVTDVSSTERKSVYSSLQQFHLPKLEDEELVAFDDRAGEVELGPKGREVEIYVDVVESGDVAWGQYYLGLALVGVGLVGAAPADVAVLSLVSWPSVTVFLVTALLVSALAHTYYTRTEMRLGTCETPPDLDQ